MHVVKVGSAGGEQLIDVPCGGAETVLPRGASGSKHTDGALRENSADFSRVRFGKPEGVVRTDDDRVGLAFRGGNRELGHRAAGVMRPIRLPVNSVNHTLPSGPAVIALCSLFAVGAGNSVTTPAVVIGPMPFAWSADRGLPPGPAV